MSTPARATSMTDPDAVRLAIAHRLATPDEVEWAAAGFPPINPEHVERPRPTATIDGHDVPAPPGYRPTPADRPLRVPVAAVEPSDPRREPTNSRATHSRCIPTGLNRWARSRATRIIERVRAAASKLSR